MALQRLGSLIADLEDPEHPLLGPTIKGLYVFGLWQTESKLRTFVYNIAHLGTITFLLTVSIDIYIFRHDLEHVLNNLSTSVLAIITVIKALSYIQRQSDWKAIVFEISQEEIKQLNKQDPLVTEQIKAYTKYTRIITYLYWVLVFNSYLILMMTPLLKYVSSNTYREQIRSGEEPLPQILYICWFPFDNTKMPGYVWGVSFQVITSGFGCGVLAVYDTNAVAIMSYLKGQMIILKEKCRNIFEGTMLGDVVVDRIKECHRHHSVLIRHYKMLNALLSPIMFFYVLVCSTSICCSVIQFNLAEATKSQKYWVFQYSLALVLQLFLFCWHGNEVLIESEIVDRGVYESDWWRGDKKFRQLTLLLAAKLNAPLVLKAGPFTTLSVPAFITILKGSYSFYTLFSQIQPEK